MSILGIFKSKPNQLMPIVLNQKYRSFNLGPLAQSEISIWLDVFPSSKSETGNLFTARIQNEGKFPVSNLEVIVKTSSGIILVNRGELFGTNKNPELIPYLSTKKSIGYSTAIKFNSLEKSHTIEISVNSYSSKKSMESLKVSLNICDALSQLGA